MEELRESELKICLIIFQRYSLRCEAILQRHTGRLVVSEDSPTRYCLQGALHPKHKTPMPIAWVQVGKNYVSFHHMGVYCQPAVLKDASKKLKARMQGKSCFNFSAVDESLFAELEKVSVRAFTAFQKYVSR